jgi:hypothetical protein
VAAYHDYRAGAVAAPGNWQEKGRGDAHANASHGVRSSGLTGTTVGVSYLTGQSVVAIYIGSLALIYTLLICYAVFTALRTQDRDRRKVAVKIIKIFAGTAISLTKAERSREVQNPAEGNGAS